MRNQTLSVELNIHRITSYNVCYTKLLRLGDGRFKIESFTLVYTQNGVVKRIVNNSSVISDEIP